jgi:hypothetical protein
VAQAAASATTQAAGLHAFELAEKYAGFDLDPILQRAYAATDLPEWTGRSQAASNVGNDPTTFEDSINSFRTTLELTESVDSIIARLNSDCQTALANPNFRDARVLQLISHRNPSNASAHQEITRASICRPIYAYLVACWLADTSLPDAMASTVTDVRKHEECIAKAAKARDDKIAAAQREYDGRIAGINKKFSAIYAHISNEEARWARFGGNYGLNPQQAAAARKQARDQEKLERDNAKASFDDKKRLAESTYQTDVAACKHEQ